MSDTIERFGEFVRRRRQEKGMGLRQMAKLVLVSPTYLSKVERDEFPPPAEDKVKAIAKLLEVDQDELLALADKVDSELSAIIKERPRQVAHLLRSTKGLSAEDLERLGNQARDVKGD